MRQTYKLSVKEIQEYHYLPPVMGAAWAFWAKVASVRGLDAKSLMHERGAIFTGLPANHDRAWCYPLPIKCAKRPPAYWAG